MFKDVMDNVQETQQKIAQSRANYNIQKRLDDGTVITVSSINPMLVLNAFIDFENNVKDMRG